MLIPPFFDICKSRGHYKLGF